MTKLLAWLKERRQNCSMAFRPIELAKSNEWRLDAGRLVHKTGGFFSVGGITAEAKDASFGKVSQPIIFQPEIGILGFVIRETMDGSAAYEWLVQAKAEPGNQDHVQLAPSVQATYSNYTRLHGGAKTHYLSYFTGAREAETLSDSLQSEQGTRFAGKFNRNIVQCVEERLEYRSDMFCWTSSHELKQALLADYAVNTDARSVIATAPWSLLAAQGVPFADEDAPTPFRALCCTSYSADVGAGFIQKATKLLDEARARFGLKAQPCALEALPDWTCWAEGINSGAPDVEFSVQYYAVEAPEREAPAWDQPLLQSQAIGEILLVAQVHGGALRVLLNFSYEVGLTGGVEFGPSYQSGNRSAAMASMKAFLDANIIAPQLTILQSDEGGRFMKCRSRYSVVLLDEGDETPDTKQGLWVTLAELEQLCCTPKLLTNEARSCVSLLLGLA